MDINKELTKLYYDPKIGFVSSDKLYKIAKENGVKCTQKEVNNFLNDQAVVQVFREQRKPKEFSSITAEKIRHEYQIDIMIYDRYQWNHYKYIIVIIDIYSRFACAAAMTNRENTTIMKNIKDIIKIMGYPKIISGDNEFNTIEFNKFCLEHDIMVRFSEPLGIKNLREALKIYNWPAYLDDILYNYNHKYHRTIRNTPYNIFYEKGKNNQDIMIVPRTFKINDKVRLRLKKKVFEKGDIRYYSKEVYIIEEVKKDIYGTNEYKLSNDKWYTGKNLVKINDIIYYQPEEVNEEEEKEFVESKKAIDLDKNLKKVGISQDNLQEGKREKKKKKFFDD
jgi:hypothetical protein